MLVGVRVLVRVRVWIRNQGTRAVKVISLDNSLASDLVKEVCVRAALVDVPSTYSLHSYMNRTYEIIEQ